jgi:prevent-host-death family protein
MSVRVNIREFKAHLSAYLRRVKTGEVVEVADRGKLVGRLIPADVPVEARLELLARLGLVVPAAGKLIPPTPAARVRGDQTVAQLLVEDRG